MATQVYRLTGGVLGDVAVPPEPLPARTLFGCAVTAYPHTGRTQEQEFAAHEAEVGTVAVHRHYDAGMPATWAATTAATYPGWEDRWTWTSVKPNVVDLASGALDETVGAWLDSIPPANPGIRRMLTCWHEPEPKVVDGTFTNAQWKAAAYRFGQLVAATNRADLLYGPVFTSHFNLAPLSTKVDDLWNATEDDLASVCDFIGWDPYNMASTTGDYSAGFQGAAGVAYYFDPITAWTQTNAPSLPVAIGETGYIPDQANLAGRADWLTAVEAYALSYRYLCACYFDASVAGEAFLNHWWLRRYETVRGDDTTLTLDTASVDAWAGVYARNPL